MWLEVPKIILGRSSHTLAAVLKLIDLELPKVNKVWAIAETEKLSNEISVIMNINYLYYSYISITVK